MTQTITTEQLFLKHKIIPVVVLNDVTKATAIAHALSAGGINIMEVTLRTANALQIIETISQEVPNTIVGAGTVLNEEDYHRSIKHGAQFIVSPGLTNELAVIHDAYDVPFIPGAITPTEIMQASQHGLNFLKFFPSEGYNGYNVLKSFASVFPKIKFCPTGGINSENASKYLQLPNVGAIGCSFIVTEELIKNNDYTKITELAKHITAIAYKH